MRVSLLLFVATIFLRIAEADLATPIKVFFISWLTDWSYIWMSKTALLELNAHGKPKYKHCKGTVSAVIRGTTIPDTCSLREFLSHVSGNKCYRKGEPFDGGEKENYRNEPLLGRRIGEKTVDFDVDYAANKMDTQDIGNSKTSPYCMVKDGQEYLLSVDKIARRVGEVKQGMSSNEIIENDRIFKGLDVAVDGVVVERRADHENRLIQELNNVAPPFKVSIKRLPKGRQVLEYKLTMDRIKAGAPNKATYELRKKLLDNVVVNYEATDDAIKHLAPIERWRVTKDLMVPVQGCALRL